MASVLDRRGALTPGQIGGIGFGVAISVVLVSAVLVFLIYRKRKSQREKKIELSFTTKPFSDSLMKFKNGSASISS